VSLSCSPTTPKFVYVCKKSFNLHHNQKLNPFLPKVIWKSKLNKCLILVLLKLYHTPSKQSFKTKDPTKHPQHSKKNGVYQCPKGGKERCVYPFANLGCEILARLDRLYVPKGEWKS